MSGAGAVSDRAYSLPCAFALQASLKVRGVSIESWVE
jgi:hypothetical protein